MAKSTVQFLTRPQSPLNDMHPDSPNPHSSTTTTPLPTEHQLLSVNTFPQHSDKVHDHIIPDRQSPETPPAPNSLPHIIRDPED